MPSFQKSESAQAFFTKKNYAEFLKPKKNDHLNNRLQKKTTEQTNLLVILRTSLNIRKKHKIIWDLRKHFFPSFKKDEKGVENKREKTLTNDSTQKKKDLLYPYFLKRTGFPTRVFVTHDKTIYSYI